MGLENKAAAVGDQAQQSHDTGSRPQDEFWT
jgi:hypothetical protein